MADISIQFHADVKEIADFVGEWGIDDGTSVVAMTFTPFRISPVPADAVERWIADPHVDRVVFLRGVVDLSLASKGAFDEKYPDQLVLDIGRASEEGLGESWLACRVKDPAAYSQWSRLARILKRRTSSGAFAYNNETGMTAMIKSHRYTPGALRLDREGLPMLPAGGKCILHFDRTDED